MPKLYPEDIALLRKVLYSQAFQNLIGAEEWDLTESEEIQLWALIETFKAHP